ncbi:CinA family protein [Hoeflea prorocentri]|uniref:CinA family protein n=1 Tax=Hoeflea prorocentri TaxID=1922333 RepID=A0A9X3UKS3_9HYPH|nr:CinA family protein [Hoeflea prorocentri]MCY6380736.1 CinA family protein [Hoeflea prorocentri]MDA5398536.1 CinA family protein [Hoeflea prorocentri]
MTDNTDLAGKLVELMTSQARMVATVESCTGGMIAAAITDIAGSSAVFDRGFVTYSNEAKRDLVGVSYSTLAEHGAVSWQTAVEMADGALARSRAEIAISVTGIAGPGGGSPDKPVGLVYMGLACRGTQTRYEKLLFGDIGRAPIRQATVKRALEALIETAETAT